MSDKMSCGHEYRYISRSDERTNFCVWCEWQATVAELAQLRAALAQAQAERDAATEKALELQGAITALNNLCNMTAARAEQAENELKKDITDLLSKIGLLEWKLTRENRAGDDMARKLDGLVSERDAAIEDAHSANAQIEVERNAQRVVWNELRDLFDCKPEESLVAVCNQTIAELATATRRAEQAEAVAARLLALADLVFDTLDEEIGEYSDPDDGEPPEWMVNLRAAAAAALAGPEGGKRNGEDHA